VLAPGWRHAGAPARAAWKFEQQCQFCLSVPSLGQNCGVLCACVSAGISQMVPALMAAWSCCRSSTNAQHVFMVDVQAVLGYSYITSCPPCCVIVLLQASRRTWPATTGTAWPGGRTGLTSSARARQAAAAAAVTAAAFYWSRGISQPSQQQQQQQQQHSKPWSRTGLTSRARS
jgi:hypothetical protein